MTVIPVSGLGFPEIDGDIPPSFKVDTRRLKSIIKTITLRHRCCRLLMTRAVTAASRFEGHCPLAVFVLSFARPSRSASKQDRIQTSDLSTPANTVNLSLPAPIRSRETTN